MFYLGPRHAVDEENRAYVRGSNGLFIKLSHSDKWQTAGGGRERKSAEDLARDEWIALLLFLILR